MNLYVIIAYAVLLFEMIYIIFQGGENKTSTIISVVIIAVAAIIVTMIGNVTIFFKSRHNEKNEHDGLSKEHGSLSKEHESLSKEHERLEQMGQRHYQSLSDDLRHLSQESIRISEMQKQVRERGVDTERMVADIRHLVQMNADQSQQIRQLTEEKNTLAREKNSCYPKLFLYGSKKNSWNLSCSKRRGRKGNGRIWNGMIRDCGRGDHSLIQKKRGAGLSFLFTLFFLFFAL